MADASIPDAATDASSVLSCGSPPYTRLWIGASTLLDHPTGPISISGSACPGTTLTLLPGSAGPGDIGPSSAFLDVTDKVPMHVRATQVGSFPFLSVEFTPDSDNLAVQAFGYSMIGVGMIANDSVGGFASLDPTWDPGTRAIIALQTGRGVTATGPCADTTGIVYTVTNHPEATGANGVTPITSGNQNGGTIIFVTTTGTAAAPELVTIVGTKTGCAVKTTNYFASPGLLTSNTGNFPVEAGAATWALAVIKD